MHCWELESGQLSMMLGSGSFYLSGYQLRADLLTPEEIEQHTLSPWYFEFVMDKELKAVYDRPPRECLFKVLSDLLEPPDCYNQSYQPYVYHPDQRPTLVKLGPPALPSLCKSPNSTANPGQTGATRLTILCRSPKQRSTFKLGNVSSSALLC